MKEPIRILVSGGVALITAIIQVLIAFNVPLTTTQVQALTGLAVIVLAELSRQKVTPMSTLPAGVATKIADAQAVKP